MGRFTLPAGTTAKAYAEAAIANLTLFIEDCEKNYEPKGVTHCSGDYPGDYLIAFAQHDLERALRAYKKECDENPLLNPDESSINTPTVV